MAFEPVAGRWTSQLPPRPWTVPSPGPRGVPDPIARAAEAARTDPRDLRFVFRALATSPEPTPAIPVKGWFDRDTSRPGSASRGLARFAPLRRVTRMRPLPEHRRERRCPSGRGFHTPTPVPSTWSLTTSTAFSAPGPAGLLHPASGPEVHRVSHPARPSPPKRRWGPAGPPRGAVTLQRVPLVSSRTASLRPLPPCLLPRTRTPRTISAHRCADPVPGPRRARRRRGGPKSPARCSGSPR